MKRTLQITFVLDNAKTKTLSLVDPKEDLAKDTVEAWAQNVIAKKAMLLDGALPVAFKEASFRKVDVELLV
ncbi:DUF2922 domain-containing protein [Mitsuokella sp. WILCCON 0060]|uniref:DUF2922 domain-containing protein n=1 Tax=Mitsuokella sp. WILCCON 0060 TaxID=3345341 RepID=UPI003F1A5093